MLTGKKKESKKSEKEEDRDITEKGVGVSSFYGYILGTRDQEFYIVKLKVKFYDFCLHAMGNL